MDIFLKNKRDPEQEYTLHLFEYCNLSCSFCWQDHDSKVGVDDVMGRLPAIAALLDKETKQNVVFNVMGGEVFAPEIFTDELRETYVKFAWEIVHLAQERDIQATVNWVTNLVMEDHAQLDQFIEDCVLAGLPVTFTTSYDPKGRFNKRQFEIFERNMRYYGPRIIRSVCLVATKQNIEYFLKDKDEFFKWVYRQGFKIYFDYLMPDALTHAAPSDTDLFSLFKFLIDHYPKCEPISGWMKRKPMSLSCRGSKLVLEDGTVCGCGNLIDPDVAKDIYAVAIEKTNNDAIEEHFLEKYNCLSCEYFQRCQLGCFMQHAYKYRDEMDECVYKATHRYIDRTLDSTVRQIPVTNL